MTNKPCKYCGKPLINKKHPSRSVAKRSYCDRICMQKDFNKRSVGWKGIFTDKGKNRPIE